jgi:prepilin signal peptidase PulO-like enzyme (type II secretory pathway)
VDLLPSAIAAVAAMVAAWFGVGRQHLLYSNPEHRAEPATGRRLLWLRIFALAAAGITSAIAFRPGHYDAAPALLTALFCFALVILSSTDLERKLLPNRLMYPALVAALLFAWAWPDRTVADVLVGGAAAFGIAIALFVLGGVFGALFGAKGVPFGMGDAKLILLIGLLCGWPALGNALVIGVLAAGVPSLLMMAMRRGRSFFSYGPYLALGAAIVLLFPGAFV